MRIFLDQKMSNIDLLQGITIVHSELDHRLATYGRTYRTLQVAFMKSLSSSCFSVHGVYTDLGVCETEFLQPYDSNLPEKAADAALFEPRDVYGSGH